MSLLLLVPELLYDVDLRVDDFLPIPVDASQSLRGLLEDAIDDIKAFSELALSACHLVLHLLHLGALLGVLDTLIVYVAPDKFDESSQ